MTLDAMQLGRLFRLANGDTLVLEPDTPYWVMTPSDDRRPVAVERVPEAPRRRAKVTRPRKVKAKVKASGAKAVRRTRRAAPAAAPAAPAAPTAAPTEKRTRGGPAKPEREQVVALFREGKSLQEVHAAFPHLKYSTIWNWKQAA